MEIKEYKVKSPDGQVIKLRGPVGASQEEVIAQAQKLYSQRQQQQTEPQEMPQPQTVNEDIPVADNRPDGEYPTQPQEDQTIGGRIAQYGKDYIGRGEAALALATGLTGGSIGSIGGTVGGVIDEIASGQFGTPDAANRIEDKAMEGSSMLTYSPRTESGREQTQAIGEAMAPLAALGPMIGEGAAIAQGVKNLPAVARNAISRAPTAARAEPEIAAAAANATPETATAVAQDPGVWAWRSAGKEHPVDILPQTYTSPDGSKYQRILYQGKETFVNADDLVPPAAGDSTAAVAAQADNAPAAQTASRIEPTIGEMGDAPPAGPTTQQSVEGLAKSITESAQASKAKKIPTMERLASEVRPDETILQAADRLGLKDQLIPSQYSKSQAYREIEQGLASIPGSQLNAQQKQAATMLAQKADDLIQLYGGDVDKAALSSEFRSKGLSTIDDLSRQSDDLYDKVTKAIPVTTKITADSTVGYLTNKAKELGGADALSSIERRALTMLSGGTRQVSVNPNSAESLATLGQAKAYERNLPTYARVDQLRKQVGEGLRGRGAFKDAESGSLKQLYARLSDDQQAAANNLGAGELFSAAKQLVGARKAIEDSLSAVLGKDLSGAITAKTGTAVKNLGSGNYKEFDKVMSAIPEDMRQRVVMTSLNDAFTAGSRAEKQLSAPGFVDWYEGLKRNNAARDRLYKYMPKEARATLDDIAIVAKGMRDANKERITTGRIQSLMENFANEGGMLSKLYGVGKKVAVAEGAGSAIGIPGAGTAGVIASVMSKEKTPLMKAADELLSGQQFKNAVSDFAKAGGEGKKAKAAEEALKKTAPYKAWFSKLDKAQKAAVRSNGALVWLSQAVNDEGEGEPSK